jgi:hypothetical protein
VSPTATTPKRESVDNEICAVSTSSTTEVAAGLLDHRGCGWPPRPPATAYPGVGRHPAPYFSPLLRLSARHLPREVVVSTSSTTGVPQPATAMPWSRQARAPEVARGGYIREMAQRPERVCVPLETEMLPLHREPPGSARLRREQKREQRRERRATPTRAARVLARLATAARSVTRRRHA